MQVVKQMLAFKCQVALKTHHRGRIPEERHRPYIVQVVGQEGVRVPNVACVQRFQSQDLRASHAHATLMSAKWGS